MPKTKAVPATTPKKSASERILAFDILRGYFLCVIIVDHLGFTPNGLSLLTGRGFLYASTAEGFFAVSGIILGIIRGRKLIAKPFKHVASLLWKRSLQLYITSIVLTFLFTAIGQFFVDDPGLKSGIFTDWSQWWKYVTDVLLLRLTYGWADFLRYYAIFLFFAPFALWLLRKGYWYMLAGISLIVWSIYPHLPLEQGIFQPVSWQLIFFLGLIVGYYWEPMLAKWRQLPKAWKTRIKFSVVGAFLITLAASFVLVFGSRLNNELGAHIVVFHNIIEQHFNKDRMNLERIAIGALWFWGLFIVVRRYEKVILKYAGWLLYSFGSNSLYVYTMHTFVIFFMHLFLVPQPGYDSTFLNFVASAFAILITWFALKKRFLINIIPR